MSSRTLYQVDEAFIRRIATIVVQRLREMAEYKAPAGGVPEKVISEQHVLDRPTGSTLTVRQDALITPLAKDTAKDRNVTFVRSTA